MTTAKLDRGTSFKIEPKLFALWLFLVSVVMLFAAFTSAYVVNQSNGDWLFFDLPVMLDYTTLIIVLSSVTIQFAYYFAKRDNSSFVKMFLLATLISGLFFIYGQLVVWSELTEIGAAFVGNVAGSFVYVLTGVHAVHVLSSIIFLVATIVATFKSDVHSGSLLKIKMCITYWHFLSGLWLYLYLFLILNH